jgi:protein SCO1/2
VLAAALLVAPAASSTPVPASERVDRTEPAPKQLQGVDVSERLGKNLPKNLAFKDETGKEVLLAEYFDQKVPVIVTLNYSGCPMLCSLMLNGFTDSLKKLDYTAGKEFRILTISLDPEETPDVAHKTQNRYLGQYGRPEARDGWHFLTGSEQNIRAVADAIGFGYTYVESRQEYAHPAALAVVSPEGVITRYLYGLEYPEKTLRLALVEGSQGRIGSAVDRLILYCFHYDSSEGRYAPVAQKIMQVGGGVSVVFLAGLLSVFFRAESKKKKKSLAESPAS